MSVLMVDYSYELCGRKVGTGPPFFQISVCYLVCERCWPDNSIVGKKHCGHNKLEACNCAKAEGV